MQNASVSTLGSLHSGKVLWLLKSSLQKRGWGSYTMQQKFVSDISLLEHFSLKVSAATPVALNVGWGSWGPPEAVLLQLPSTAPLPAWPMTRTDRS